MNTPTSDRSRWLGAMKAAAALTRAGRLGEASALIRRAMAGAVPAGDAASAHPPTQPTPPAVQSPRVAAPEPAREQGRAVGGVIDVTMREVDDDAVAADVVDLQPIQAPLPDAAPTPMPMPMPMPEVASPAPPDRPADAGTFTSHELLHGSQGMRRYKLHVPPTADGSDPTALRPLLVMLHGCTQDPDDFAAGTAMNLAAQRDGYLVMYPEQTRRANPQRCWNWFFHRHQQRGAGEPDLIAAMVGRVQASHAVDPARVYVAGLSAGGAMAAVLGAAYPDVFAAIGVHSGLPAGAANDVASALLAMKSGATPRAVPGGRREDGAAGRAAEGEATRPVPSIVFHGDADTVVNVRNGEQLIGPAQRAGLRPDVENRPSGADRAVTLTRWIDDTEGGLARHEHWLVHGGGHAWFGGEPGGSYTDTRGPDASGAMLRFFAQHRLAGVDR